MAVEERAIQQLVVCRYVDLDRRTILAHCAAVMYVAQILVRNNYNQ
jgi:hypothetical protein